MLNQTWRHRHRLRVEWTARLRNDQSIPVRICPVILPVIMAQMIPTAIILPVPLAVLSCNVLWATPKPDHSLGTNSVGENQLSGLNSQSFRGVSMRYPKSSHTDNRGSGAPGKTRCCKKLLYGTEDPQQTGDSPGIVRFGGSLFIHHKMMKATTSKK